MAISNLSITDDKWRAIVENDKSYDGVFWYAVKTTGIFCRPSCKSRPPKRENIRLFKTAEQALAEQFRPCKRCKPTGQRLPDHEWIVWVTEYVNSHYMENLTLHILAEMSHGSPYHLHRTFKRIMHKTPMEYIQKTRLEQAKKQLIGSDKSVAEVGKSVGLSNTPYFITLFKKNMGCTPLQYRQLQSKQAQNGGIQYGKSKNE
ncbi:bifunctional transcriptional activator/DNA repair enzyme AdaA [Paenibacillus brasilensis]|uniref:AraC family transcriptional regulator of adaptative response / methylphosphotriester-DNA alkyltransferase methyltransferase n=1 Tax=Paenibacillus brasilensis TaxID=128574 RepID=A0ABU0L4Y5_9BACL|nr:bifunctional transcriptional activator/DNA repair enzyme AdaA [Paenibacillus brasilensis]MDQ0496331.1 AraC family transcriptional regulator of adaptative response / methylphosphotriester-DNA alkyltransferase methyltransferase [Paenibacillus brasilensis]